MRTALVLMVAVACSGKKAPKDAPPRDPIVPPLVAEHFVARFEKQHDGGLAVTFNASDAKGKSAILAGTIDAKIFVTYPGGAPSELCTGTTKIDGTYWPDMPDWKIAQAWIKMKCTQPASDGKFEARIVYKHPYGEIALANTLDGSELYETFGKSDAKDIAAKQTQARYDAFASIVPQLPTPGAPATPCPDFPDMTEAIAVDSALLAELADKPTAPAASVTEWTWLDSDWMLLLRTEHKGEQYTRPQYPKSESRDSAKLLMVYHFAQRTMAKAITMSGSDFKYQGADASGSLAIVSLDDMKVKCHAPFAVRSSPRVGGAITEGLANHYGADMMLQRDLENSFYDATAKALQTMHGSLRLPAQIHPPKPWK